MKLIVWFRHDLRLQDHWPLNSAMHQANEILFVYIRPPTCQTSPWGFPRVGEHRELFIAQGLDALNTQLNHYGHSLHVFDGVASDLIGELVKNHGFDGVVCEEIAAPEEVDQVQALRAQHVHVQTFNHAALLPMAALPFKLEHTPNVFTNFRKAIENATVKPCLPINNIDQLASIKSIKLFAYRPHPKKVTDYTNSAFPISETKCRGGEGAGQQFLAQYFNSDAPKTYKQTRNGLIGLDFSTKFSPWLAQGFLSPRQIYQALKHYEANVIENDSTYWIWFELLWRDYFRLMMAKFGSRLFCKTGLGFAKVTVNHDANRFEAWCQGKTDSGFINAGMNELNKTGFLSNRMRQIVASYLINELHCDWRAGAAWFEAQLIDYDVFSNQGNWAYIAGCGTDPRGGRHFNIQKQQETYDPEGRYVRLWSDQ